MSRRKYNPMGAVTAARRPRCGLPTASGKPCRRDRNCSMHGQPQYYELRRQAYERWASGERPRHIAAEWGVTSRDIRHWVGWYRRHLPSEDADGSAHLARRRRWMLELRNAGHSYAEIGERYGILVSTVRHTLRQALEEVGPDERVAEPVLDWLRERLMDEPDDGLAPETLQSEADAAMGYPVCRKLLRDKWQQAGWQVRNRMLRQTRPVGTQAESDAHWRARRLEILARRQAGETESELADAYGVTLYQVRTTLVRARAEVGAVAALSRLTDGRRAWAVGQIRRRRLALELRNAGAPRSYVAEQLGVTTCMVTYLTNMGRWDAASSDPERAGAPVAEPLLDWLAGVSADWVGMPADDFVAQAAAAMGHPVERYSLCRKMAPLGYGFRRGRLARRDTDAAPAPAPRAVA